MKLKKKVMKLKVNCKIIAPIVITLSICSLIFNGIMVNMNTQMMQNQKDMEEILREELTAIDTIEHHNTKMYDALKDQRSGKYKKIDLIE